MSTVELKGIQKNYGEVEALKSFDLRVEDGEFVVLVGPSGCGKSTLLRAIAGLEQIDRGQLFIDGKDMTNASSVERGIGMVFQSYALYPHMTVAENIGFGLKIGGESTRAIAERVHDVAAVLQLGGLLSRKPKELSGGQRQRVAIGRALARKPKIFLFDEPLSNLDASLRAEMRVELAKLHNEIGSTMIYVTHDQVEAMTLADRMVVMRSGAVEQIGAPLELFNHPKSKFVGSFLGQPAMNFIKVEAKGDAVVLPGGATSKIPATLNPANVPVFEIGCRPEAFSLSEGSVNIRVLVKVVEQLGSDTLVYGVLMDGNNIVARINGQAQFPVGGLLMLHLDLERAHLFDMAGRNLAFSEDHVPANPNNS